ncbi:MAG: tetratricopeptide repeat protein [Acidobacteriota bacterium]
MNRVVLLVVVLLILAAGGGATAVWWWLRPPEPEWTSASPRAIRKLETGLADLAKMYAVDAVRSFEEALELDPSFAMPKLHLALLYPSRSERMRMVNALREVELEALTPRERFLLSYELARFDGREGDASQALETFRERDPEDPYGIRVQCRVYWEAQKWDAAEECYHHLLALHPNWVEAHNNLGYIAMGRGRFTEAEERFQTYRYLAPDQANPRHSLAMLLTVLGRYEEAQAEIDEMVTIKADFCDAYTQKIELGMMSGQLELARGGLEQLRSIEACSYLQDHGAMCSLEAWVLYLDGELEAARQHLTGSCLERLDGFDLLAHRLAVMNGDAEQVAEMEQKLRHYLDKVVAAERPIHAQFLESLLAHMRGIQALAAGDYRAASEALTQADQGLGYWGGERANIKLFNQLNLLRTLELGGRAEQAAAVRRSIDAVNPRLIEAFPLPDVIMPSSAALGP